MKFRLIFYLLFILIFFPQILFSKSSSNIILKIGNEIVTNYEVKNKILTTLVLSGQELNQNNINSLKKRSLDTLIEFKLKKLELSKYNFKTDQKQINAYLMTISSNNIDNLKEKFEINKLDYKLFLDEIETQFKWQKLIFNIYSKRINIDEESINDEINDIIKTNSNFEEFKLSEIEILYSNNDLDKKNISDVQNKIKTMGFENAALTYSISDTSKKKGELGWINGKSLSSQIYKIISELNIGDVSKPIKRPNTILFLKLLDKKDSQSTDIDIVQLKNNLITQKKNDLFGLYSQSHLSKLKNNNLIEYK